MRENQIKRRLSQGGVAVGTMVFEFNSSGLPRIAAGAGAEFLMFDQEHTGWTTDVLRTLFATCRAVDCVPLVRVPALQYHLISQALDLGAMGVMVPMVETSEQAETIMRYAKYPPAGRRGAAFGVAHDDYVSGDVLNKMKSANAEVLLIAMIETTTGLENLDSIAAVPGVDVLWLGHFDLTASMGIPAQFDEPRYLAAVDRIAAAANRNGKAAGFMVAGGAESAVMLAKGYRCLAFWGDIWIYAQGLREGIQAVKSAASSPTPAGAQ